MFIKEKEASGLLKRKKETIKKLKKQVIQDLFIKAYFQHDMTYGDFKNLPRRTTSDKILCDTAFSIAKNPKDDGYQRGLL